MAPVRLASAMLALVCLLPACTGAIESAGDGGSAVLPSAADSDGDNISDVDEGKPERDTDEDGIADWLDDDSDGDGIKDAVEGGDDDPESPPRDADADGTPDFLDLDADGNGREDSVDGVADVDEDLIPDFADVDDDGDLIEDADELGLDVAAPLDTDADGDPDFRDVDSDGDEVSDYDEQQHDGDGDDLPAFRDPDADGDCRLDTLEAGDEDVTTAARDLDLDGTADFLDLDSDGDGLLDQLEDLNCNGLHDLGEADASRVDTDGDGVTDLVEVAAATDVNDATDNPQAHGDFVFEMPYQGAPNPTKDTLDFATDISRADVFFVMDTTGSMGGEISTLKTSLSSVISTLAANIPDIAFGVGGYDDFTDASLCYGASGIDKPFYLLHRIMTVGTAEGLSSVQSKVSLLSTHGGSDGPESGWQAMHEIATGEGIEYNGTTVPAFDASTAPPIELAAGEEVGATGGVGFRPGALPIVVWMTDAHNHNSEAFPADAYGATCNDVPGAATRASATGELMAIGARVIGVISNDWDYANAKSDASYAVSMTGAVVPPEAWGDPGMGGRPANCEVGTCCTGQDGVGEPTDAAGECPLAFTVSSGGTGLGDSVIKAIEVLTRHAVLDIEAQIEDASGGPVNAVTAFVDRVEAQPVGSGACTAGLTAVDTTGDGAPDTFLDVEPGATACFDLVPKTNTVVMPTAAPQMFTAEIQVVGDDVTTLSTRTVYFLVPPEIPNPVD